MTRRFGQLQWPAGIVLAALLAVPTAALAVTNAKITAITYDGQTKDKQVITVEDPVVGFELAVTCANTGDTSGTSGSLGVSFVELDQEPDASAVTVLLDKSAPGTDPDVVPVGSVLDSNETGGEVAVVNTLASVTLPPWPAGEVRTVTMQVRPKRTGPLTMYVWCHMSGGGFGTHGGLGFPIYKDQQDIKSFRVSATVQGTICQAGAIETLPCVDSCMARLRTCSANAWGQWGGCTMKEGGSVCELGEQLPCGKCGTQVCEVLCGTSACMNEGVCSPTDPPQECGACMQRTCDTECTWSECLPKGSCVAGETRPCEGCASGMQTCLEACEWGPCESTAGSCSPGENVACGPCGLGSAVCGADCEPDATSCKVPDGACTPGDSQEAPCGLGVGECKKSTITTTCDEQCAWQVGDCQSPQPMTEVCGDGKDNDCNGVVDDCGGKPSDPGNGQPPIDPPNNTGGEEPGLPPDDVPEDAPGAGVPPPDPSEPGTSKPKPLPATIGGVPCEPGHLYCDATQVVRCGFDGYSVETLDACPYGCISGQCLTQQEAATKGLIPTASDGGCSTGGGPAGALAALALLLGLYGLRRRAV